MVEKNLPLGEIRQDKTQKEGHKMEERLKKKYLRHFALSLRQFGKLFRGGRRRRLADQRRFEQGGERRRRFAGAGRRRRRIHSTAPAMAVPPFFFRFHFLVRSTTPSLFWLCSI